MEDSMDSIATMAVEMEDDSAGAEKGVFDLKVLQCTVGGQFQWVGCWEAWAR